MLFNITAWKASRGTRQFHMNLISVNYLKHSPIIFSKFPKVEHSCGHSVFKSNVIVAEMNRKCCFPNQFFCSQEASHPPLQLPVRAVLFCPVIRLYRYAQVKHFNSIRTQKGKNREQNRHNENDNVTCMFVTLTFWAGDAGTMWTTKRDFWEKYGT